MGGGDQRRQPAAQPSPLPSPPYQPPQRRFDDPLDYMHMPMEAFEKTITAMVPRSLDELQSVLNQMMGGAGDRGSYAQDVLKGAIGMKQNLQTLTQEPVGTQQWWDAAVPTGLAAAGEFAPMVPRVARGSAVARNPIVQEAKKVQETLGPQRDMTAGELDAVHRMMSEWDNPPPLEVTPEPPPKDYGKKFREAPAIQDEPGYAERQQRYHEHIAEIRARKAAKAGSAMRSGGKEPPPPGAVRPHERPDFQKGSIHINVRGNELDLTRPLSGWVLPAELGDFPNTMSTRYGRPGLTAVYVPKEFVQTSKTRPAKIKEGYVPPPENIAVIPPEAMRESGTIDWTKVFGR